MSTEQLLHSPTYAGQCHMNKTVLGFSFFLSLLKTATTTHEDISGKPKPKSLTKLVGCSQDEEKVSHRTMNQISRHHQ